MYYEENESIVSDQEYEEINKQLVDLIKQTKLSELKKTTYYYCMEDYDGSTGMDLKIKTKEKRQRIFRYSNKSFIRNSSQKERRHKYRMTEQRILNKITNAEYDNIDYVKFYEDECKVIKKAIEKTIPKKMTHLTLCSNEGYYCSTCGKNCLQKK
jgi:hypothetical protein